MTHYIILRWHEDAWKEHGAADASSPRRALAVANVDAGGYVAIPSRSWKPLTVKVETTTKTTIE
jgi:hypothetical protein